MTIDANTFYLNQELNREAKADQQQAAFDYQLSKIVDDEIHDAVKEHRIIGGNKVITNAFIISWDSEDIDDVEVPVPSFYSFTNEKTTKNSLLDIYYRLLGNDFKKVLDRFTPDMWKQSMKVVDWQGTKKQFKQNMLDYDALNIKEDQMPFNFETAWLGAFLGTHYDSSIDYNYEDLIMYLLENNPKFNCYYDYDSYESEVEGIQS